MNPATRDSLATPSSPGSQLVANENASILTLVNTNFVSIPVSYNVGEAIRHVRRIASRGEIFYLYVVDEKERLLGVVSIRNLLIANDEELLQSLLSRNVVFLSDQTIIRDVYRMFSESHFLSLPVVNEEGKIKGVLHAHELMGESERAADTLFEERSRGQLFELLGIKGEEGKSTFAIAKGRLPWLMINILGGTLSAFLIHYFGGRLKEAVLFLAFVPILLIISESVGMQAASVAIGILNRAGGSAFGRFFGKEIGVAACLGTACALGISAVVFVWLGHLSFSIAIGLTVFVSTIGVSTLGSLIPYFIHKFRLDPSVSAGPVLLAVSDFFTLLFYLGISLWVVG